MLEAKVKMISEIGRLEAKVKMISEIGRFLVDF